MLVWPPDRANFGPEIVWPGIGPGGPKNSKISRKQKNFEKIEKFLKKSLQKVLPALIIMIVVISSFLLIYLGW